MANVLQNYSNRRNYNPRRTQYLKTRDPNKPRNVQHEQILQKRVCDYVKERGLKKIMFRSDTSSGRWEYSKRDLEAKVIYNSQPGWPDIMIFEPRHGYAGLAIELKKDGTTVVVTRGERKGHLTTNPHIQAQAITLRELAERGWFTTFAVGFDNPNAEYIKGAKNILDWYFGWHDLEPTTIF